MDYCKNCKSQTRSIGIPEFIKKNNKYRRLSVCKICNTNKNNISKLPELIEAYELFKFIKSNVIYYKIYDIEGTVYEEELLLSLL